MGAREVDCAGESGVELPLVMQGVICCHSPLQQRVRGATRMAFTQRCVAERPSAGGVLNVGRWLESNHDARHAQSRQPAIVLQLRGFGCQIRIVFLRALTPLAEYADAEKVAVDAHRRSNVPGDGGAHGGRVGRCDGAVENNLHDDRGLVSSSGRRGRC